MMIMSEAPKVAQASISSFHSARRLWAAAASSRSQVDPPCALCGAVAVSAALKASLPGKTHHYFRTEVGATPLT